MRGSARRAVPGGAERACPCYCVTAACHCNRLVITLACCEGPVCKTHAQAIHSHLLLAPLGTSCACACIQDSWRMPPRYAKQRLDVSR